MRTPALAGSLMYTARTTRWRAGKVNKIILSLIARERATDASNVPQNASFLSLRAQIYALAFPFSRFREEMFAAHTAGRNLYDIIWIARGKPKAPTENERVISQFQKAIKNAPRPSTRTMSCVIRSRDCSSPDRDGHHGPEIRASPVPLVRVYRSAPG